MTYFRNIETKIENLVLPWNFSNLQRTNTPKNVAVYFKDVNTEETLSSQYQKLVETTNLWRQLLSDKDHHGANSLVQQPLAQIHLCNDHYPSRTEQMN